MAAPPSVEPSPPASAPLQREGHLWDYVHVLLRRRRAALAVFSAVVALATLRTLLTRPVYEGTAQILIERSDPNVLNFKQVAQEDSARDDYYQTQYKLLQSRSLARLVIAQLDLLQEPEYGGPRPKEQVTAILAQPQGQSREMEQAIDVFLGRESVRPIRNSRLVTVSVESRRPELAAQITNALAALYIKQSLDLRVQTSSEAGKWLATQIDEQRRKVEQLDAQLQDVKRQEGLVNIEERRTLLEQRLKELGTALNERKTERLQKEALWRQMAGAANPEELPEVMHSQVVQSLRIELASLERQQAQLLERYLDQHPEVVKVRNQIAETRTKIRAEAARVIRSAENDYKAAAAQEHSVSAALESAKQEALDLGKRGVAYDSQKHEVDAANQVLDNLMSRAKETDVASELKSTNIRVVDPASIPDSAVRPRRLRDIALGFILGLFLSIGAAFFLEYLDNTLKTPDDVRDHLGVPLLGVIPEQTAANDQALVLNPSQQGPFPEGYRVVRTSLSYSWSEPASRVLVITSTSPGEGKTLTSVNLAATLGAAGHKVLLVDADLRKPQAQTLLRARRTPGLSDALVGNAKPSEVIQQHLDNVPFAFLPSGTTVPSPADLLTTRTMPGLVDGLRQIYDWILIDTPPVGAVAEALILAPLSDGVVVVAGAEMVPRKAVIHTLERIADTGVRMVGIVLNRAQIEKHSYYYSHYYGHYHGRYEGGAPRRSAHQRRPPASAKVAAIREGRGSK
jgi:capsular exopolysaccharide synthesis family protein